MRIIRNPEDIQVDGSGLCPPTSQTTRRLGGRETDWLVTLQRPEGLLFIVFTAPDRDFQGYESAFRQMLYSVRVQSGNNSSLADQEMTNPTVVPAG